MKTARFVLKIVGASLALASFVCLAIGYWDKMSNGCCHKRRPSEYDDYADVE
ncbi:MAG: hypothetical protein PHS97_07180 [Oscillospiraceae bacterium]|nr:hypothetical protein [Oscillospiraceae bacterium]